MRVIFPIFPAVFSNRSDIWRDANLRPGAPRRDSTGSQPGLWINKSITLTYFAHSYVHTYIARNMTSVYVRFAVNKSRKRSRKSSAANARVMYGGRVRFSGSSLWYFRINKYGLFILSEVRVSNRIICRLFCEISGGFVVLMRLF